MDWIASGIIHALDMQIISTSLADMQIANFCVRPLNMCMTLGFYFISFRDHRKSMLPIKFMMTFFNIVKVKREKAKPIS